MAYFIKTGDQIAGPITKEEVQQQLKAGKISRDTMISSSASGPWKSIADASNKKASSKISHIGDSISIYPDKVQFKCLAGQIWDRDEYTFHPCMTEVPLSKIETMGFQSPCTAYPGRDSAWNILYLGCGIIGFPVITWFLTKYLVDWGSGIISVLEACSVGGLILITYSIFKLRRNALKGGLLFLNLYNIPFKKRQDAERTFNLVREAISASGKEITISSAPQSYESR